MAKPVIGLIGGIGSGKSHVAALLRQRGGRVISGDQLGHKALRQPEIKAVLVNRWGSRVLDDRGEVDRHRVAGIVFAAPEELKALEAIVFPLIGEGISREIETAQGDESEKFLVLDAAVMLEAGWNHVCDKLVFVNAPREVRLRRLLDQRGWSEKELADREAAQMPLAEKAKRADFTIESSDSAEDLGQQIDKMLKDVGIVAIL